MARWSRARAIIDAFLKQAAEYESEGVRWDTLLKAINTALREHPFNTVRAAELQRWVAIRRVRAHHERRVPAARRHRGRSARTPTMSRGAADYYGQQARDAFGKVGRLVRARGGRLPAESRAAEPVTGSPWRVNCAP